MFIVTLVTSTWSFEVNERTQEILKLVTYQFNENVRLQERVPSTEIRHPDCVPVSSRRGWQSYLQYPFILWDLLAQFPHLFDTRSLLCPICLEDSEKAALEITSLLKRTNHWLVAILKDLIHGLFFILTPAYFLWAVCTTVVRAMRFRLVTLLFCRAFRSHILFNSRFVCFTNLDKFYERCSSCTKTCG